MSIYADKKPKVSSKNNEKKPSSSIYYDLPDINYRRSFESQNTENSNDNSYSKPSDDRMKYLMKKYREIIHYNSPEPRKYGARAFTKNSEIYIAPGEENALPHELGHVYQQVTQNIPATGEMKGEKVNTDPKLEKEAEENYKNINNHIPKVFISDKRKSSTNSVMQFAQPNGAVAKCCTSEYDIENLFEESPGSGIYISLSKAIHYCVFDPQSEESRIDFNDEIREYINELKKYCDDDDDEEIKTYKMTASDSKWELSAVSGEEEKVSANGTYTLSDSSVKITFENITYEGELKSTDIDLTFKSYSDKISKPDTDSYELDADKTFNTAVSEAKQVFKSMILSTDSDITESVSASNQSELNSKAKSLCTNALTFAANLDMAGLTLPDGIICGSLSTEKTDEKPEKTADEDGFRKQMNYMMGGDVVEYFYAVSIKRGYPSHVIVSTSEDKIKAAGNDPDSWKASEDGTLGYFKETIGS